MRRLIVKDSIASGISRVALLMFIGCVGWFGVAIEAAGEVELTQGDVERILRVQPYPAGGVNAWNRWLEFSGSFEDTSIEEDDILYSIICRGTEPPVPELLEKSGAILTRYQPFLNAFKLRENEFVGMRSNTIAGGDFPNLFWFRQLARLKAYSASTLWWGGKKGQAFSEAIDVCIIGGSACRYTPDFIGFLTGIAVRSVALEPVYWMTNHTGIEEDSFVAALDAIEGGDRDVLLGFERAIRGDYELMLRLWSDNLPEKEQWLALFSELRVTVAESVVGELAELSKKLDIRLLNRQYTREVCGRALAEVIALIEDHEYWEPQEQSRRYEETIDEWGGDLEAFRTNLEHAVSLETESDRAEAIVVALRDCPNPLGAVILENWAPALDKIGETTQVIVATSRLIALLMQMRLITSRGDELPESLPELLPVGYSQTTLMDPLSGERFKYDPLRKAVWSVGRNRIDDNGSAHENTPALGKDIVLTLGN
jgi:hypothetical protein